VRVEVWRQAPWFAESSSWRVLSVVGRQWIAGSGCSFLVWTLPFPSSTELTCNA
jgi:hypothetical protein